MLFSFPSVQGTTGALSPTHREHTCLYIYIYTHTYHIIASIAGIITCVYMSLYIYLSLSLYIYIYIYVFQHLSPIRAPNNSQP